MNDKEHFISMSSIGKVRRYLLSHLVPEFVWPAGVVIDGIQFKLRGTPYSFGVKYLLARNASRYEYPERVMLKYIQPGDKVLELGSSLGIVTRCIAERVGPRGQVLAIEASEKLSSYSKTWQEALPNVKVLCAFAFPVHREIHVAFHFDDSKGSLGGTVIFDTNLKAEYTKGGFFIENIENEFGISPDVLVCDIEGSEIVLLHERAELPNYLRTIIIELHPSIYTVDTAMRIIERIKQMGFALLTSLDAVYVFQRIKLSV